MSPALALLPLGMAAVSGAALAGCGAPACPWSSLSAEALKIRLSMLRRTAPDARRSRLAALGLAGLMCAGALTAYAAEPSGPDAPPREVVGVVGSGDQLQLKVAQDQKIRTLKPGDAYRDGWTLEAVTTSTATFSKNGQSREVGLNPAGAVASAAPIADPSKVEIAGDTLEERSALEREILNEYWTKVGITDRSINPGSLAVVLGPARYQQFIENDKRLGVLRKAKGRADALAAGDLNKVRAYDHQPVVGPDTFVVGEGMTIEEGAQAVGLNGSFGYSLDPIASRGQPRPIMVKCFGPSTPDYVAPLCNLN